MNDFSLNILNLFTSASVLPNSIKEDFSEVILSIVFTVDKILTPEDTNILVEKLNDRDDFHISLLKDDEIIENYASREGVLNEYIESLKNGGLEVGDTIEMIITIIKNKKNNYLSVYFINEFTKYLENLSFLLFLKIIEDNTETNKLILEIQDGSNEVFFETKTIKILNKERGKNDEDELIELKNRTDKVFTAMNLCHWDIEKKALLPDDLYPIVTENINENLVKVFQKACILYTLMFIFDYSSLKEDKFLYKLNGYKTFGEEIKTSSLENINIDIASVDLYFKIYEWIYIGGNTNDKISIARNIISLNYEPKSLLIAKTSFDSILSNYKIYERQNVKQYIEVRNKLSEILIGLQEKIDKIVDGFISDFKKNIITIISFFISVIVIRAVSKGDFIGGFTLEVVILSYAFLAISIGILFYSRWELTKRVALFDKHYGQLKERYKELLSEEEINKIFDECNPKNLNTKSFVNEQKRFYTILWWSSILILGIAISIIYITNNLAAYFSLIHKLELVICYIKNILK